MVVLRLRSGADVDEDVAPGTLIGAYRIEARLGEGGMGVVYRALDTKLNRPVAIKFLSEHLADAGARRRFQREAQMASSLNHPHVLTVHETGDLQGRQYLVTEFVDAKPDGTEKRDLGPTGAWACWSGDGKWVYYSTNVNDDPYQIRKVSLDGGTPVMVRDDDAIGCAVAPDGSAMYYGKILRQAGSIWDFEVRVAKPESGPSRVLGRVEGRRVPVTAGNYQGYLSPDGRSLAMPLVDGSTTNLWSISTDTGAWRKLTDFGARNVSIARRIGWSRDSRSIYASVAEIDSDIVMLKGLR